MNIAELLVIPLAEVFAAVRDDAEIRVVVLRGAGHAFCAGADLREFGAAPSPTAARRIRFARDVWGLIDRLRVPTIAAIHGYAIGSGFELALFCDLRIAAEGTQFAFPEARYGMIPAAGGTVTLGRTAGLGAALDLLLTGRRIDASEALRLGAVSWVVPQAELESAANRLVDARAGPARVGDNPSGPSNTATDSRSSRDCGWKPPSRHVCAALDRRGPRPDDWSLAAQKG